MILSELACPRASAIAENPSAAPIPAAVPSRLMAPSVPRGTLDMFVIRNVVFPYACTAWFDDQEISCDSS